MELEKLIVWVSKPIDLKVVKFNGIRFSRGKDGGK